MERRQRSDGQPATARPVLPSPDIPHLSQGQSRRSRSDTLPKVRQLWLAQVLHARPSAAMPWPPGSAAGGALLCWWPLCRYSCSRRSPGSFPPPVPPYGNTDGQLLAHQREEFLKFLGMIDILISPLGCRNPWPPVGKWEAY